MSAAIQAVFVRGHEERTSPKRHTVFRIEINANVRSWQMWRRYSEFVDLNTELTNSTGSPPPAPLPPKHALSLFRTLHNEALLEERRAGLEAYLRAIVSAREDTWRDAFAFREFLGIPVGKRDSAGDPGPARLSGAAWLDEHAALQGVIRDVRADVNRRDALGDRGDVGGAHAANVQAKKRLAGVLTRVGRLAEALHALGMGGLNEGELQRRTDMTARLQDDCEKLGRMVTVARQTSRLLGREGGAGAAAAATPAPESDRAALLGANALWAKPVGITRVFGAAAKPQETERTRPLDDAGVLQLQKDQMSEQDAQLSQLSTILARQKQLGVAIGTEIAEQNAMLDHLGNDVDHVGNKLTSAKRQMNRLG